MYTKTLTLSTKDTARLIGQYILIIAFTFVTMMSAQASTSKDKSGAETEEEEISEADYEMLAELVKDSDEAEQHITAVEIYNENHELVYRAATEVPFKELPTRIQERLLNCDYMFESGQTLYYVEK